MEYNKFLSLIDLLRSKTEKRVVIWQQITENSFKLELKTGAITILKDFDPFGNLEFIEIKIYNIEGNAIVSDRHDRSEADFSIFEAFYNSIIASYYKVDETIKGIIDELNSSS